MKKLLFLSLAVFGLCLLTACEEEPWEDHYRPEWRQDDHNNGPQNDNPGNNNGDNNGDDNSNNGNNGDNNSNTGDQSQPQNTASYTITKLYAIVMRRTLPYPFSAYVLQIDNGEYFYMLRYRYNQDLSVGDKISFSVYAYNPNEIAVINGCDLGDGSEAEESNPSGAGEYLVASDPIEATVADMFSMKVGYSIPVLPSDSWFILTTDGNLIYVKKSKLNVSLKRGDRFVYNTYTLFPNEVLEIKKL